MRTKNYIKFLTWHDDERADVTLGPGTRINPQTNCAQLGTYGSDIYSTDLDLYVKSRVTSPQNVRRWVGFDCEVKHKFVDNERVTSVGFRLSDGVDEYWWNGAGWSVNTSSWNSEEEVAANIAAFSALAKTIQVVVNLSTLVETETPELVMVRVLYAADVVSEIEDIVERSLIPRLKSEIRPFARVPMLKHADDLLNEISLSLYKIDTDYRFVGAITVYNHTDDPTHEVDLYQSHTTKSTPQDPWHDGTVDVITLSQDVDIGKTIWLEMEYEPFVNLNTNQDYYELAHVPSLVVERVTYHGRELVDANFVADRSSLTAALLRRVYQGMVELTLAVTTDKLYDSTAMQDELFTFFADHPTLESVGLDESYRFRHVGTLDFSTGLVNNELRTWRITAYVDDVLVFARGDRSAKLIERFIVNGDVSFEIGGPPPSSVLVVAGADLVVAGGDQVTAGGS